MQKRSLFGWPGIFWHCLLGVLLLAAVANFFYMFQRLSERVEREEEASAEVFERVPAQQRSERNLKRWHDSSLIFYAVDNFRSENDGRLPPSWDGELLDTRGYPLKDGVDIQFQSGVGKNLSTPPLPEEEHFHIWPGHVCSEDQPAGYWENMGGLTYDRVIGGGGDSDFAIVYGAENPGNESPSDFVEYIRCLDSLSGPDRPDFILKRKEVL